MHWFGKSTMRTFTNLAVV